MFVLIINLFAAELWNVIAPVDQVHNRNLIQLFTLPDLLFWSLPSPAESGALQLFSC